MKKIFLLALAIITMPTFAQKKKDAKPKQKSSASGFYHTPYATRNSGSFDKQTHLISLTYGFPNTLDYDYFLVSDNDSGIGPVNVRYEFPIRDEVGVGLALGGAFKKWDFGNGDETKVTGFSLTPLGFYHFNKLIPVKQLDVYAGVGANVEYIDYKYNDALTSDRNELNVYPTALVGARYYFTDAFSGLLEVGGSSYSIVKIGVSFRL